MGSVFKYGLRDAERGVKTCYPDKARLFAGLFEYRSPMRRLQFIALSSLLTMLTACGVSPLPRAGLAPAARAMTGTGLGTFAAPARPRIPTGARNTASGPATGYLALVFAPSHEVADQVRGILGPLGFVDPGHMIPPRDPEVLHATVAFFHVVLPETTLEALDHSFRGKDEHLTINGTGVVNQQVAYLTLAGLDAPRAALKTLGLAGDMDDPHITIGASPGNPRDIHGVPKPAQRPVGPYEVDATYHLYVTTNGQMHTRW